MSTSDVSKLTISDIGDGKQNKISKKRLFQMQDRESYEEGLSNNTNFEQY